MVQRKDNYIMNECIIDTDILSYYMRGVPQIVTQAQRYLKHYGLFNVSSLTIFEILKGLRKKGLLKKETTFKAEMLKHNVFGLDYSIMDVATTLLVDLEEKGTPLAYGDLFIAATALARNLVLVTNNTEHFLKIEGLVLENWIKSQPINSNQ